jgi:hypothetical protein
MTDTTVGVVFTPKSPSEQLPEAADAAGVAQL